MTSFNSRIKHGVDSKLIGCAYFSHSLGIKSCSCFSKRISVWSPHSWAHAPCALWSMNIEISVNFYTLPRRGYWFAHRFFFGFWYFMPCLSNLYKSRVLTLPHKGENLTLKCLLTPGFGAHSIVASFNTKFWLLRTGFSGNFVITMEEEGYSFVPG